MVVVTVHPEPGEPIRTRRVRMERSAFSILEPAPGFEVYIYERALLDEIRAAMDDEPAGDNAWDSAYARTPA